MRSRERLAETFQPDRDECPSLRRRSRAREQRVWSPAESRRVRNRLHSGHAFHLVRNHVGQAAAHGSEPHNRQRDSVAVTEFENVESFGQSRRFGVAAGDDESKRCSEDGPSEGWVDTCHTPFYNHLSYKSPNTAKLSLTKPGVRYIFGSRTGSGTLSTKGSRKGASEQRPVGTTLPWGFQRSICSLEVSALECTARAGQTMQNTNQDGLYEVSALDIPAPPQTDHEWANLIKRIAVKYLSSSRTPNGQEIARITVRDLGMRVEWTVSHDTLRRKLEEAAVRLEGAEFEGGELLWSRPDT